MSDETISKIKGNAWVGLLLMLVFVMGLSLALISDIVVTIAQAKRSGQVTVAQALCDAGIEKAVWKLNTGMGYSGETLSLPTGTVNVAVSDLDTQNKEVIATASVGKIERTVRAKIRALPSSEDVSFHYALQAGEGGIHVTGSSEIHGNLYSNADVTFSGGGYDVTGDVFAHGIVSPNPNSRVHGIIQTGAPVVPLPEVDVESWKALASEGNVISGSYSPPSGTTTFGPTKITGSFSMSSYDRTIRLRGPLYIQGAVNISGGKFILDDSLGTSGTLVIVDGPISVSGGAQFITNTGGGYILFISTNTHSTSAISYQGSATSEALALFAPDGGMSLSGSGEIVATCGKTLTLGGSGEIRYKSGLANANFSAGPGGSWKVVEWQILY